MTCIAYVEGNDPDVGDLEDVSPVQLADTLRVLDAAQVVLPEYVHNAQHAVDGSLCDSHALAREDLRLIEGLVLELEHVRLLAVDHQCALALVDEVYAADLSNIRGYIGLRKSSVRPGTRSKTYL